jgi:hypothetical protein
MNRLYQDPALPKQQPTDEDLAAFTRPVAEMDMSQQAAPVAQPRAAKGLSFDWSVLNAQTQEEYDAKPPAIQQLIHEIQTKGILPSQEAAANRVMEIQKMIDERNSPKAQAEASAAQLSARKTQLDIGKLEQETIANAKEQAELNTRKQLVLEKINKYTNPKAPNFTDISPLVGKFDGTAGAMLDAGGANDQRAAQRAELERLVNNDVLELTKFLKPVSQDELKFLKSMSPRLHQNDTIWREYLLDAKSRIEGMSGPASAPQTAPTQSATAQPQQPAQQNIRKTPAGDLIQLPNGKYYPAQFYRP